MDEASTDMVMTFTDKNDGDIFGEGLIQVDEKDNFMKMYKKNVDYQDFSNFFDITEFTLDFKLNSDDASKGTSKATGQGHRQQGAQGANGGAQAAGQQGQTQPAGQFSQFYQFGLKALERPDPKKKQIFPVDKITGNFTRIIDHASIYFLDYCSKRLTFKSAALVKRLSQGSGRPSMGYFKIEFEDVTITSVSWSDGDLITEDCDFTCQKFTVMYAPQKNDGTVNNANVNYSATYTVPLKDPDAAGRN